MKDAFKRLAAYLLDLLLIYFVAAIISAIIIIVVGFESYIETYDSFIENENYYQTFFKEFEESFADNNLSSEEYNKLISNYEDLTTNLTISYEDLKLSQKEYDQIYDEITEKYDDSYIEGTYNIAKEGVIVSIVSIILTIAYFVFFQYFTNGQTIGKKILNLRVTTNNSEHVTINSLLLRSLIITDIIWATIKLYCLYTMNAYGYYNACYYINSIMYFIIFISLLCIIYRKDKRALQDLFAGTKVIETGDA